MNEKRCGHGKNAEKEKINVFGPERIYDENRNLRDLPRMQAAMRKRIALFGENVAAWCRRQRGAVHIDARESQQITAAGNGSGACFHFPGIRIIQQHKPTIGDDPLRLGQGICLIKNTAFDRNSSSIPEYKVITVIAMEGMHA